MMKKIKLTKEDIYNGYLILINRDNLIKNVNIESSLESYDNNYKDILYNKVANKYLHEVLNKINAYDSIVPVSGYRTLLEQQTIYNDSIKESGLEFTQKYVALPNTSEHQSGLAIDLGIKKDDIDFICPDFPHEGICNEFRSLALQFGFIERYKEDKENITKISAEEWHFRYVGYPHSLIMDKYNFCLEEYIEYLKNHKIDFDDYTVSYIPFKENLEIELNEEDEISGNNIDGFIITQRKGNTNEE